ncbi:MAG: hypothetical protein EZS28_043272, partial [Streblomastix strix]
KAAILPGGRWRRFAIILGPRVRIWLDGPRIIHLQFSCSSVVNQGWPGHQGTTTIAVVHYSLSVIKVQDIIGIGGWILRISFSHLALGSDKGIGFTKVVGLYCSPPSYPIYSENLLHNQSLLERALSIPYDPNVELFLYRFLKPDASCGAAFSLLRLDTIEELSDLIRIAFVPNCAKRISKN